MCNEKKKTKKTKKNAATATTAIATANFETSFMFQATKTKH